MAQKKPLSEVQIIGCLWEAEAEVSIKDLCRRHGLSDADDYLWRSKFGGMTVPDVKRLKALEQGPPFLRTPRGGGPYLNRAFLEWVDPVSPAY